MPEQILTPLSQLGGFAGAVCAVLFFLLRDSDSKRWESVQLHIKTLQDNQAACDKRYEQLLDEVLRMKEAR